MSDGEWYVSLPYATFSLTVRAGRVAGAAPVAGWALGKDGRTCWTTIGGRGPRLSDSTDPAAWDAYVAAVRELWGGDTELMRLVIEYGEACNGFAVRAATVGEVGRAEAAIREHVARHYVRRERLVPDEWDDLDATAPVKTGYKEVTVRIVGRERVVSAKYEEGRDDAC